MVDYTRKHKDKYPIPGAYSAVRKIDAESLTAAYEKIRKDEPGAQIYSMNEREYLEIANSFHKTANKKQHSTRTKWQDKKERYGKDA